MPLLEEALYESCASGTPTFISNEIMISWTPTAAFQASVWWTRNGFLLTARAQELNLFTFSSRNDQQISVSGCLSVVDVNYFSIFGNCTTVSDGTENSHHYIVHTTGKSRRLIGRYIMDQAKNESKSVELFTTEKQPWSDAQTWKFYPDLELPFQYHGCVVFLARAIRGT